MDSKRKVLVLDYVSFDNLDYEREALGEANIEVIDGTSEDMELREEVKEADGILVEGRKVGKETIERAEKCKIISIYGTGYDNVDVKFATKRGIYVTTAGDYCVEEVANHTLALILASMRKLCCYSSSVKFGNWEGLLGKPVGDLMDLKALGEPIPAIGESVLGIVGFGRIGRRVAKKSKPMGFDVIACDPYIDSDRIRKEGVKPVDLKTILEKSDVISLHVSLTKETEHMFSDDEFKRMKSSAILVNTCRGPVVDEEALIRALVENEIQAAALDVLEKERPPAKDNPLFQMDNVVITPHCAFYSEKSQLELRKRATNQVLQALRDEIPDNLVNKELVI